MRDLPRPLVPEHLFLAGVCERLDALGNILGEIRDRLGQASNDETPPAETSGPQSVELREPDPPKKATVEPEPPMKAEPVELAEPEPSPVESEPKPAPRRRATKSTKGAR